jgi:DNA invertase Pin-like site-specific DNA recombinase
MRAACYARFSSDLQRPTSIVDQIAAAKKFALDQRWTFLDDHVYTDAAISGSSLDRPGIQALLNTVVKSPLVDRTNELYSGHAILRDGSA